MRQPVSHAKHNETHMSELLNRRQRLRKRKKRNIILNTVCILLVLCAIVWTVDYFWRYFKYETTNDAVIDQYISPVGIRVSGYIKEVRFTEHQPVKAGVKRMSCKTPLPRPGIRCSCSTTANTGSG